VPSAQEVGGKQSIETEIKIIEKYTHEYPIPDQDQPIFSAAHPRVVDTSTSKDRRQLTIAFYWYTLPPEGQLW
jgi:hypothetical protein